MAWLCTWRRQLDADVDSELLDRIWSEVVDEHPAERMAKHLEAYRRQGYRVVLALLFAIEVPDGATVPEEIDER